MTETELKAMKIHEKKNCGEFEVLRVYKGWIYTFTEKVFCSGSGDQYVMTSVFVPR